jgi:steroid 5-alpha reductase family enzyme
MSALEIDFWIFVTVCFLTWITSVITKEYSWVDRIWSIIPIVYVWVFAYYDQLANMRVNVMAVLVTLWGARLTFNFARKGGYAPGGEDYRWAILRKKMSPALYQVFNIFFIVIFQNALLLAISIPANLALETSGVLNNTDYIFAGLFLALLILETTADQQQWSFHQRKLDGNTAKGFLDKGLFAISRHPNFFAEQAQWWVLAGWGVATVGGHFEYFVGAIILTALFIGSARFTEQISAGKYPEYKEYQRKVSMMIPWFPKR